MHASRSRAAESYGRRWVGVRERSHSLHNIAALGRAYLTGAGPLRQDEWRGLSSYRGARSSRARAKVACAFSRDEERVHPGAMGALDSEESVLDHEAPLRRDLELARGQ